MANLPYNEGQLDIPEAPPAEWEVGTDGFEDMVQELFGTQGLPEGVVVPSEIDSLPAMREYLEGLAEEYLSSEEPEEPEGITQEDAEGIVQRVVDTLSEAGQSIQDLTVEDILNGIKDLTPEITSDSIAQEVLGQGAGVIFPDFSGNIADILRGGQVFVPGIPAPLPGSSIIIGTIEDLIENPVDTLVNAGQEVWDNIISSVQDPSVVLDAVFGDLESIPPWLEGVIYEGAGEVFENAQGWFEDTFSSSGETPDPTLPFDDAGIDPDQTPVNQPTIKPEDPSKPPYQLEPDDPLLDPLEPEPDPIVDPLEDDTITDSIDDPAFGEELIQGYSWQDDRTGGFTDQELEVLQGYNQFDTVGDYDPYYLSRIPYAAAEIVTRGWSNYHNRSAQSDEFLQATINFLEENPMSWQEAMSELGHTDEAIAEAEASGYNPQESDMWSQPVGGYTDEQLEVLNSVWGGSSIGDGEEEPPEPPLSVSSGGTSTPAASSSGINTDKIMSGFMAGINPEYQMLNKRQIKQQRLVDTLFGDLL